MSDPGHSAEQHSGPDGLTVLEPSLWQALTKADGVQATAQAWAPLMHAMLDTADLCAVILPDPTSGRLHPTALWPKNRMAGGGLINAAETAIEQGRGVVRGAMPGTEDEGLGQGVVAVAVPLSVDGKSLGAVGIEATDLSRDMLQDAMRKLQWGAAWMRDVLRAESGAEKDERYTQAAHALHIVGTVAEQSGFSDAARAMVTDLATRFGCDRVSVGFRRIWRTKVRAISHTAQFGKEMNLVRMLGAAMDEAIDQRGIVIWPEDQVDEPMATHRHAKLAEAHHVGHLLTCPLYAGDKFVGAITFERPSEKPFNAHDAEILEAVSTVIAPVLNEVRRNDRWLVTRMAEVVAREFARLFGPGRLLRKAVLLGFAGLLAFFWFATGVHRISGDARIEGTIQRAISAPFDGFIAASEVRAGDLVKEGTVLVRLDDRDLTLERLRLASKLQLERIEYERALAIYDRAEASIHKNQIAQAEAEIALVDEQLARTKLTAPFDGVITSGDLSQSIGASVARGESLMSVVPADGYRVVLKVDERQIADISKGQIGTLVATALPEQTFPVEITKVTPVAEYGEGRTTFRVDARLTEAFGELQTGMEGVVKIDIEERRLIGIWSQPMVDWARLRLWYWLGWSPQSDEG